MPLKYKVAILTRSYPPKDGGIAAAHFGLAQCLMKQHEVAIFAFDDDDKTPGTNVFRAKTPSWLASVMSWLARRWVRHYAKNESATNCERIFQVAPAIRSLNKSIRKFDPDFILCPDNYVPALALKKPKRAKLIWVAHNNFKRFEGNPIATRYSWIDLQLAHRLELRGFTKSDALVAVSDYMLGIAQSSLSVKCPAVVIKNHIDSGLLKSIEASSLRQDLGLGPEVTLIYIPSGGSDIKGERYTWELIRRLGQGGLVAFFVSGHISPRLKYELDNGPCECKVHRPGQQGYAKNLSDVAACDLTVSPTLIENLSSAFIESLALGIPVITFDVGGNAELIESEKNGILVPYLDVNGLIARSEQLLLNKEALISMKAEAKASMPALNGSKQVLKQYGSLFSSLVMDGKEYTEHG